MFRNLFLKTLYDYRFALLGWGLGFIFVSFYIMYFYPFISDTSQFLELWDKLPPFIKNLAGDSLMLGTPEGFFSIQPFSMMAPLMLLVFAIQKGGDAIAGEKARGTLDLLLANPVPRYRLVLGKWAAMGVSLFVLCAVFWIAMTLGAMVFKVSIAISRLAEVILSGFMLGLLFASLTLFLSCIWIQKKVIIGIVSGFALVTYLVEAYAPMVAGLKPYRVFSPFYYYNGARPLINGLDINHFLVLFFLALLFFIMAVAIFQRGDLA